MFDALDIEPDDDDDEEFDRYLSDLEDMADTEYEDDELFDAYDNVSDYSDELD